MKKTRLIDRVRYQFDNYMSRGTGALIGALAVISLLLILAAGVAGSLIAERRGESRLTRR